MKDREGRRLDCHFLIRAGKKPACSALTDFYNTKDETGSCDNCPFFKTDEEFEAGWKRRMPDVDSMRFTTTV